MQLARSTQLAKTGQILHRDPLDVDRGDDHQRSVVTVESRGQPVRGDSLGHPVQVIGQAGQPDVDENRLHLAQIRDEASIKIERFSSAAKFARLRSQFFR